MYVTHLMARNAATLAKIYAHSFNKKLSDGTLPVEAFTFYLQQDALYLKEFAKALLILANRFSDTTNAQLFKQLSEDMISAELSVHRSHLKRVNRNAFFYKPAGYKQCTPVIMHYSQHLLTSTRSAPIAEAVASCIPCFVIYKELGELMSRIEAPCNPYQRWIDTYSSPAFIASAHSICERLDELTRRVVCPFSLERINTSFSRSVEFELHFFDTVEEREGPKIKSPLANYQLT